MQTVFPEEYDILFNVTYRGVAVQISDRSTDTIIHEQNDLNDIEKAISYVLRSIETRT
jgi:hypothetical protein